MKHQKCQSAAIIGLFCLLLCRAPADAKARFVAYSLREAASLANKGSSADDLLALAGITRISGMVYDKVSSDLILIGLADPDLPEATLDDLVVALRARMLYQEWPLVSIDPLPKSGKTKQQAVRFGGNIQNTAFGEVFLDCDILLKNYSLQLVRSVSTVPAYNVLLERDIRHAAEAAGTEVLAIRWCSATEGAKFAEAQRGTPIASSESHHVRFWFYVQEPYVYADKNDVFGIKELSLALKSECAFNAKTSSFQTAQRRFPEEWTAHFEDMFKAFPDLRRLKVLYDLTAIAEAVRKLEQPAFLSYFLNEYSLPNRETTKKYRLEEIYGIVERSDGLLHLVRISGGIEFKAEIKWLNDGDFTPLRDIVLKTRPSPNALAWRLPLDGWRMQNARYLFPAEDVEKSVPASPATASTNGCSVSCQSFILDPKGKSQGHTFSGFDAPHSLLPSLKGISMRIKLNNQSFSPDSTGRFDALRETILKSKPSLDSLSWPVPDTGGTKNEEEK